jgi:hypothetical protein
VSRFHDDMTLREAREVLRTMVDEGHDCPCCRQHAKVYRRKVHASMAAGLIRAFKHGRREFSYLPDTLSHRQNADFAKLVYWSLIEPELEARRSDGSKRTGRWRVTAAGEAFLRGTQSIQKYARIYNGRCLSLTGELVTIRAALGKKFNYEELMSGV